MPTIAGPPPSEPATRTGVPALSQTPPRLSDVAEADGRAFGEVRIEHETARRADTPVKRFFERVAGVRKAQVQVDGLGQQVAAESRQVTGEARKGRSRTQEQQARDRGAKLNAERPAASSRVDEARAAGERIGQALRALPAYQRGYVSKPVLVGVEAAVVLFDCFVMHGAAMQSGMDDVGVWGTSLTVPLAMAACNISFGTLAGVIGQRLRSRVRVAGAVLVGGLLTLIASIVLLGLFRADATSAQNAALAQVASGGDPGSLSFFVSPLWMMPLSLAGSIAAMIVMALWVVALPGRELRAQQAEAGREQQRAVAELAELDRRIEAVTDEADDAALAVHDIEADVRSAEVEATVIGQWIEAGLTAEDQLALAMQDRYEAEFLVTDKLYANGGVWRAMQLVRAPWRSRGEGPANRPTPGDDRPPRRARAHDGRSRFARHLS